MKRSNIDNQRSFWGSVLVAGLALASSLLVIGCAADADSDDGKGEEHAPAVDNASNVNTSPYPIPAAPAQLVDTQTRPYPIPPAPKAVPAGGGGPYPIPAAQAITPQTAASGDTENGTGVPIPAFTKP
ncbi:hypothetical protein [Pendulispora rubella]